MIFCDLWAPRAVFAPKGSNQLAKGGLHAVEQAETYW